MSVSLQNAEQPVVALVTASHPDAESQGIASRSAVTNKAVRALRASEVGAAYEDAWDEWNATDAETWEQTVADGIGR